MKIQTRVRAIVRDSSGVVVHDLEEETHSLLGNFIGMLFSMLSAHLSLYPGAAVPTLIYYDGNVLPGNIGGNYDAKGVAGQDWQGVVVGTGAAATTIDQATLGAKILPGNTVGKLQYGESVHTPPADGGSGVNPRVLKFTRTFTNVSGGSIVIAEMGVFVSDGGVAKPFLVERSLVSPFNVPDLGTATVVWSLGVLI